MRNGSRPAPDSTAPSTGFTPISGPAPRVLILGSLPSRRSLVEGRYYAHPRNAFWPIMGRLFDAGPDLPYAMRAARLKARGIAVWDVLQASCRPGSLDASIDIHSAVCNDFNGFFAAHPELRLIAFNGRKASELFRRLFGPNGIGAEEVTLPSTSPAHAAMTFDEKLRRWSVIGRR